MVFIYLHGFNSKGNPGSNKLKELSKLGNIITLDYDSFATYDSILDALGKKFKKTIYENIDNDFAIAGTSLGAFWAATLGNEYQFPTILINPSITPKKTLTRHVGITLQNYVSGETKTLSKDVPASYPDIPKLPLFLILLDAGDDVISPEETEEYFTNNTVIKFEGGSHRFEHMAESLPHIQSYLNNLETIHY
jgi:uncharacterized protein